MDARIRDDAAAGNLRGGPPVVIDVWIIPELCDCDRMRRADAAAADQFADFLPCVAMAGLDGDLQDFVILFGGVDHGVGLFDGHGDWFFADDMQAGVKAVNGRDGVAGGRRRIDDGVEIGLGDHFAIVFVSLRDMESFGEFLKLLRIEVAEGDEFEFVRIVDDAVAVDVAENGGACADGADADLLHVFSFVCWMFWMFWRVISELPLLHSV